MRISTSGSFEEDCQIQINFPELKPRVFSSSLDLAIVPGMNAGVFSLRISYNFSNE